jgi:transcriptional regulator with XRE-family HTH domain
MSTRDLERLARAVKAARLAQYPSRLAAAQAAGISKDTWKRVEEGEDVRDGTYAKMESALTWTPGQCLDIAAGGPLPHEAAAGVEVTVVSPEELDESVRDIVQLAAIATTPGLSGQEIRELANRIAKDLRAAGKI